jgi:hypothetical protein
MTTKTAEFYKTTKLELQNLIEKAILNNEDKKLNYLYNLALSMIKNNNEKSMCPFNSLYFQLSDKQEIFINSVSNKVNYNEAKSNLFLENGLKAKLSFYRPTTNKKTYITFLIN